MSKVLDFIKPGVVTGDDVQKLFSLAKENNFALPAINCIGIDSINAVLESAAKFRSPVVIQFSHTGSSFMAGLGLNILNKRYSKSVLGAVFGALYIHYISGYYGVPVILHTDHCSKQLLPWLSSLLDVGEEYFSITGKPLFSSHMIDLSNEPLKENILISSQYLSRMKKINMTLEIELGCTGGEEDAIDNTAIDSDFLYTCPEDVSYAYEKLHIISSRFIVAASFGNVHGVYRPGNVKLKPKILYHSQQYVSKKFHLPNNFLNLVFHGGSGSSADEIREAISYGIVKVNIDTDVQWATWSGILQYYKDNYLFLQTQIGNSIGVDQPNKKFYDPRVWIRKGQLSVVNCLEQFFKKLNIVDVL
ncbi:class II fructose-bisphosphate aldolase [Blochmannia endosymbiont of Polyrhachis (Hedomyrma) turneri]|uniref:class II fructose-bisphosphate aldolase n=1 Tax=Blochmannia endosymbiont of Polyrhachis (Hedomyrma) turneri TaxID=1505596 RepID=UPI00061A85ED|nr:class II fructose-bisphosphate aldolase [Blochmannia endosymbiont of Polyrhachis (Hedomyrma) turneri]AKC59826.1 Fructose-bisphosphate aldolase class 2 [Blochmannia endosymbiont of Polyrhachis (Hedomyrma) turneri]